MTGPRETDARRLGDAARAALSWIGDNGFRDVRFGADQQQLLWWLQGPGARIWIGARTRWLEAEVLVGPPRPEGAPWTERGFDFVSLEALRHARGLPVMRVSEVFSPAPGDPRDDAERFGAYVAGLGALRATELAGDWSRLDAARAALPELRRAFRAPWRADGESAVGADGVTLRLDTREAAAINGALNWVVNGVGADDADRWTGFGVTRAWAREVFARFRAPERGPDGFTTVAFAWPELRFVAAAVRSVLAGGRHRFPSRDIHTLTGVWEEEMAAVSGQLQKLDGAGPVRLRAATPDDLGWVAALAAAPEVEPSLAPGAADGLAGAVERGELLVTEDRRAAARLVVTHERHRIGAIRTLMVDPAAHGRGVGLAVLRALAAHGFAPLGLHRLEAEVYGFNVAACRLFDRAGWTREGVRRAAWQRHGEWQDGVTYGLLAGEG